MLKTNVYIDGFNLYYGCLRRTAYRWLDVAALAAAHLPVNAINRIYYFTAIVEARPGNPAKPLRQAAYLDALSTLPNLQIQFGRYLSRPVAMPLASPLPGSPIVVNVIRTEEKGSDVNLVTCLIFDAFRQDFEAAVVISNDSDLTMPIYRVRRELGLKVGVISPHPNVSWALKKASTFYKTIDVAQLPLCQFPDPLQHPSGRLIHKPATW